MGLAPEQLNAVSRHDQHPADFTELEHLVIRYAEQLTAAAEVDEDLDAQLAKHLTARERVELAVTVAIANATTRVCNALDLKED